MSRSLFGTDGVRGVAGSQLTADLALRIGEAATRQAGGERPQVLIVRDTRESGEMLQAALAAGIAAAGGDVLLGGVLPTPAAPLLLRRYELDLAAVISASHNPFQDNGIKLFAADGFKLSDEAERAVEAELAQRREASQQAARAGDAGGQDAERRDSDGTDAPAAIGRISRLAGAHEDYLRELHLRFAKLDLDGVRIALDCANGATSQVAPEIFKRLGAEVSALASDPDGRNINARCGSTHPQRLMELMMAGEHHIGFAFDGDGDRVLAVDREGALVDGDELLALIALHLQRESRLLGNGVAVTVMSNFGFHTAMQAAGIAVASTNVGDRYVLEELRRRGWTLGGEQSGHIIEMGFNTSGDGIASALLTLEALAGGDLADRGAMERLPQRLQNVRVAEPRRLDDSAHVAQRIAAASESLVGRGRVLVRPSGTEPLVRVMVEAPSEEEAEGVCSELAALIEAELGGARA